MDTNVYSGVNLNRWTWFSCVSAGQSGIIAGVCAILTILLVFTVVIVGLMCYKKDNMENYTSKRFEHNHTEPRSYCLMSQLNKVCVHRKVHSAPDKLNPVFQHTSSKDRPQISEPVFMESTATQACAPLIVTPSKPPQVHSDSQSNSNFYYSATVLFGHSRQTSRHLSHRQTTSWFLNLNTTMRTFICIQTWPATF